MYKDLRWRIIGMMGRKLLFFSCDIQETATKLFLSNTHLSCFYWCFPWANTKFWEGIPFWEGGESWHRFPEQLDPWNCPRPGWTLGLEHLGIVENVLAHGGGGTGWLLGSLQPKPSWDSLKVLVWAGVTSWWGFVFFPPLTSVATDALFKAQMIQKKSLGDIWHHSFIKEATVIHFGQGGIFILQIWACQSHIWKLCLVSSIRNMPGPPKGVTAPRSCLSWLTQPWWHWCL